MGQCLSCGTAGTQQSQYTRDDTDNCIDSLLKLLFSMQARIPGTPPLSIGGIGSLSLDGELRILHLSSMGTPQQCIKMAAWFCENVSALKNSSDHLIGFEEALSAHCEAVHELRSDRAAEWNKQQLPLSLFVFVVEQLLRNPVNEWDAEELQKERSAEGLTAWLTFNDLVHRYCVEQGFEGAQMRSFWNEVTDNGQETEYFGWYFRDKICAKYEVDLRKFRNICNKIASWYSASSSAEAHLTAPSPSAPASAFDAAFDPSYLVRRLCYAKPMMLKASWSHVVEAVRHEMYARMANKLRQFEIEVLSADNVIQELKSKTSGVSGNEIAYIKQLVRRATELDRSSALIRFEKRYVDACPIS